MLHEKVMKTTESASTNCVFVRRHGTSYSLSLTKAFYLQLERERLLFELLVSDFHDCATDQLGGVLIRLCAERCWSSYTIDIHQPPDE